METDQEVDSWDWDWYVVNSVLTDLHVVDFDRYFTFAHQLDGNDVIPTYFSKMTKHSIFIRWLSMWAILPYATYVKDDVVLYKGYRSG